MDAAEHSNPDDLPHKFLYSHPILGKRALVSALTLVVMLAVTLSKGCSAWVIALVLVAIIAAVSLAVHHAEVIALRVGEPFGTLVLALAVTVIETALIVALMLSNTAGGTSLVRDTVYAAVMIVCNGVIGLALVMGCWKHHVLRFRVDGAAPALSVLACLSVLVLVLPSYTTSTAAPTYSNAQLWFAATVSLGLYLLFVFVQTVRHRDYFLPLDSDGDAASEASDAHRIRPNTLEIVWALIWLLVCLTSVVGLAKALSLPMQKGLIAYGLPAAFAGVLIAILVLAPETAAAVRAARHRRMQTSLNLAIGSGLATIGLTIPTVVVISQWLGMPLTLGLPPKEAVLLALTLLITTISISRGHVTILHGGVHLALFGVFLFLTLIP